MKRNMVSAAWTLTALVGAGVFLAPGHLIAQNPFTAPTGAMDTLNEGSTGPNAAAVMPKVRDAAGTANAQGQAASAGEVVPPPPPSAGGFSLPSSIPGITDQTQEQIQQAGQALNRVRGARVKAIYGTRVFDAVTGEMLDDAQLMYVDEATKEELGLVDNGDRNKGDLVPDDQVWTAVEISREFVGQSNQRLKERLVKAISSAEQLTPLEFFGYHILTTERINPLPRNRTWKLVSDPKGRGKMLVEQEVEKPVQIPKFREEEIKKDDKIAGRDGWAIRFLDEYRVKKGDVESEFYPVYIPKPPVPPAMPPPGVKDWKPFSRPAGADPTTIAGRSPQGYKIKTQTQTGASSLGEGAPTSQPYFNSNMTQRAFGVNTGRR